jgi:AcrR family transcriptional regulator
MVRPMPDDVKGRRPYHAPNRAEQAAATRRAVLAAARDLFTTRGYPATTVAQIAQRAGVNTDTLYAAVGRKPELMRAVVESALSGTDHPVPAAERDHVRRVRAAGTATEMIDIYAAAIAAAGPRTAPVFRALRDAAVRDERCAALHAEIVDRRAANMRLFAADLRATGQLRPDLDDDTVADIVWSTNAAEYYLLLVDGRGWTPERFGAHLADLWRRVLLA